MWPHSGQVKKCDEKCVSVVSQLQNHGLLFQNYKDSMHDLGHSTKGLTKTEPGDPHNAMMGYKGRIKWN